MAKNNIAKTVGEDFYSSLLDLKQNSKPHINMLTMLAEENISYASVIVEMITKHIKETNHKLCAMYLMDSILKNVGREYKRLFASHLLTIFSTVFKHVEESTRRKLYDLRQTWNEIFPPSRLYMLDVTIKDIDPAWPLTAAPNMTPQSQTIHVNPKFKAPRINSTLPTDRKGNKLNISEFAPAFPMQVSCLSKKDLPHSQKNNKKVCDERKPVDKSNGTIHIAPWKAKQFVEQPVSPTKADVSAHIEKKTNDDSPSKVRDPRLTRENKQMTIDKSPTPSETYKKDTRPVDIVKKDKSSCVEKSTLAVDISRTSKKNSSNHIKNTDKQSDSSPDSKKGKRKYSIKEYENKYKKQKVDNKDSKVQPESSKILNENLKTDGVSSNNERKMTAPITNDVQDSNISSEGDVSLKDTPIDIIDSTNDVTPSLMDLKSLSPKKSDESSKNGNNINNSHKVCVETENPVLSENQIISSGDVDLRKLPMAPFSNSTSQEMEDPFSLFGKEDVDYRKLQFPPLPLPPIFPCAPHMTTQSVSPNFLASVVPTPLPVATKTPQNASLAVVTTPHSSSIAVTSSNKTSELDDVSLVSSTGSNNKALVPPEAPGLVFDELTSGGFISSRLERMHVSPEPTVASRSPPITEVNMIEGVGIDLTSTGNGEIDCDIMCIDDMQNNFASINPLRAEVDNDYYSIISDIDDQLQWGNITRYDYNALIVLLQDCKEKNELNVFRTKHMSNMKTRSAASKRKTPSNNKNNGSSVENIQPAVALNSQTLATGFNNIFSQQTNSEFIRTPAPHTNAFSSTNNLRPPYPPQHFYPPPQAFEDAYGSNTYQFNPPANMVPQTRAPGPSIVDLQSILATFQVKPTAPKPTHRRGGRHNRGRHNRRGHNRHDRGEMEVSPVLDEKWLPKKDDMWNSKFLKRRNDFLIRAAYYGTQCSSCGLRFKPEEKEKYSNHLDWHFRMNKKQQESTRKANCRNWFHTTQQWKMHEEIGEIVGSSLFDDISGSDGSDEATEEQDIPSVAVSGESADLARCPECLEKFKNFFHHDLEDWHYRNAIERNGLNYHPLCYEDVGKRQRRMDREEEEIRSLSPEENANNSECEITSLPSNDVTPTTSNKSPIEAINDILGDLVVPQESQYIKQETISVEDGIDMFLPPPMPRLLADLPLKMEIKEEDDLDCFPVENFVLDEDVQEIDKNGSDLEEIQPMETDLDDIIDGNDVSIPIATSRPAPIIKISMAKSHNASPPTSMEASTKNVIKDLLKPAFEGLDLQDQPVAHRGMEMSSLCSIM